MIDEPDFYPGDLAAHLTTAWIYDKRVWQADAQFINLAYAIPTPGVPARVLGIELVNLGPPRGLLEAFHAHRIGWEDFQTWYRAYLGQGFHRWRALYVVAGMLRSHPQVIILGSEKAGAEGEEQVLCARRLFRRWLLGTE